MPIPNRFSIALVATLATVLAAPIAPAQDIREPVRKHSATARLNPERLAAAHADAKAFNENRRELPPLPGLNDYKAIFHAHASDSDHTGGTRPEMLRDAKRAGVDAIFLSDHFRPPRDFMDSWRGLHDGVLFIPGSEAHGCLIHPETSVMELMDADKDELLAAVTEGRGMAFLCHVEERFNHPMDGLTGMEVYNRHADAKDDMEVLMQIANWATDPEAAARLEKSLDQYPDEVLAAQLDYPELYFNKWDQESTGRQVVGIAANDCHHNQVFIAKMVDETTVRLGTVVDDDEDMRVITAEQRPGIKTLTQGHEPGDILVRFDFDPYYRSFYNVSTHIFASRLSEPIIRDAVANGHAYISHDWMCNPEGFRYIAHPVDAAQDAPSDLPDSWYLMGDQAPLAEGLQLKAEFPVECWIRLLRDGEVIHATEGQSLDYTATEPGTYRVEGWLQVDGEDRIWIYSNPIYVQ